MDHHAEIERWQYCSALDRLRSSRNPTIANQNRHRRPLGCHIFSLTFALLIVVILCLALTADTKPASVQMKYTSNPLLSHNAEARQDAFTATRIRLGVYIFVG
jgi:hypothetical protein